MGHARWAWTGCMLAGLALCALYADSVYRFHRRFYTWSEREPERDEREWVRQERATAERRAESGEPSEGLDVASAALARECLSPDERAMLLLTKGRCLERLGRDPGPALQEVTRLACGTATRAEARVELARLHEKAGDLRGAIAELEATIRDAEADGILRPTEAYFCNFGAMAISDYCDRLGDARAAFEWAWRAKYDFAFDGHCGNAIREVSGWNEDLLVKTASRAGIAYAREEFTNEGWARRRYGAPLPVDVLLLGVVMAIAGVLGIGGRWTGWVWRRWIWRKRPAWVAVLLAWPFYVVAFLAFCVSYRVPDLAHAAEKMEDPILSRVFAPLSPLTKVPAIEWLANGFSGNRAVYDFATPAWILACAGITLVSLALALTITGAFCGPVPSDSFRRSV